MHEHRVSIHWRRETDSFDYPAYNRSHLWQFESGVAVPASAAPPFLGTPDRVDPEEAFVAAISSCHMLTFLAICSRKRIRVDSYTDHAIGYMEENARGKLAVTRVDLDPQIVFGENAPGTEAIQKIHHLSHEECFIANSVNTEIRVLAQRSTS
jgi:organic hydroperoxide reductase OsmC/OhrA